MSRFYASIQGNRGMATRQGTEASGISGHIRGWEIGIEVVCFVGDDKKDHIRVYKTGGSSGSSSSVLIKEFVEGQDNNPSLDKILGLK